VTWIWARPCSFCAWLRRGVRWIYFCGRRSLKSPGWQSCIPESINELPWFRVILSFTRPARRLHSNEASTLWSWSAKLNSPALQVTAYRCWNCSQVQLASKDTPETYTNNKITYWAVRVFSLALNTRDPPWTWERIASSTGTWTRLTAGWLARFCRKVQKDLQSRGSISVIVGADFSWFAFTVCGGFRAWSLTWRGPVCRRGTCSRCACRVLVGFFGEGVNGWSGGAFRVFSQALHSALS
jgi:hypothetical protein